MRRSTGLYSVTLESGRVKTTEQNDQAEYDEPDRLGAEGPWRTFSFALGAEPRDHLTIRGASGLDHPVQSLSLDEKSRRLIIVSAEPNPRIGALMQVEVQATMPETHVLVARPVVFDLGVLARRLFPSGARAPWRNATPTARDFCSHALLAQPGMRCNATIDAHWRDAHA